MPGTAATEVQENGSELQVIPGRAITKFSEMCLVKMRLLWSPDCHGPGVGCQELDPKDKRSKLKSRKTLLLSHKVITPTPET